eukprot:UN32719
MSSKVSGNMCEESRNILNNSDNKNILIIRRNKNANVVIYQCNMTKDGKINDDNPIEVFWLKIEPSYVIKNRESGKKDDRIGLNFLESTIAYGLSTKKIAPQKHEVNFKALPGKTCILTFDTETKRPICQGRLTEKDPYRILNELYVNATENFIGYPTVNYVDVYAEPLKE